MSNQYVAPPQFGGKLRSAEYFSTVHKIIAILRPKSSLRTICSHLNGLEITTPAGMEWTRMRLASFLRNTPRTITNLPTKDTHMSTKKTAAPEAQAEQAVQPLPHTIVLTESSHVGFSAACHLVRMGYFIDPNALPQVYGATGQCTITLVKGSPDAHAVAIADAAAEYATQRAAADYEKDVVAAATRMIEDGRRAEKHAALLAEVAESEKALRNARDRLARTA